ncbi:hypothetical protein Tco_1266050 [Tanacetum coccineum]
MLNRVFKSPCFMVKSWLVQDQTVLGKDYSNLLIADSLLKTIWFINAPCYGNEALASPKANELTIPEQTATGKGKSNPFMAGSLPKTTKPTYSLAFDSCKEHLLLDLDASLELLGFFRMTTTWTTSGFRPKGIRPFWFLSRLHEHKEREGEILGLDEYYVKKILSKTPELPFVANDLCSNDTKRLRYKKAHEASRKDVERASSVLNKN